MVTSVDLKVTIFSDSTTYMSNIKKKKCGNALSKFETSEM